MSQPAPTESTTPRAVFERMLRATLDQAWDDFADLYAEDVVIEWPFAPAGVPKRSVGREALRSRLKAFSGSMSREFDEARPIVIHETVDPEVIVTEYDLHGRVNGNPFTVSYVMVVRVRDGLVVSSRDYSNAAAAAAASRT